MDEIRIIYMMFMIMIGFFMFCMIIIFYMFRILSKTIIKIETIRKCKTFAEVKTATAEEIQPDNPVAETMRKVINKATKPKSEEENWVSGVNDDYSFKG